MQLLKQIFFVWKFWSKNWKKQFFFLMEILIKKLKKKIVFWWKFWNFWYIQCNALFLDFVFDNFEFLPKISIVQQKISIVYQHFDFWRTFCFVTKISVFHQHFNFLFYFFLFVFWKLFNSLFASSRQSFSSFFTIKKIPRIFEAMFALRAPRVWSSFWQKNQKVISV